MPKSRRRKRAADPARLPVSPPELEAITEADRRFFERHPGRSHRVRHTGQAEIEEGARAGSPFDRPYPGFRWFTAVRQIRQGVRIRAHLQAPAECEVDLPEPLAAEIYQRCETGSARALTARLIEALKGAGAL